MEIELLPVNEATDACYNVLESVTGIMASMYKATLTAFLQKLYTDGYALAKPDATAHEFLKQQPQNTRVGKYLCFTQQRALTMALHHADKQALPVALISQPFTELVRALYRESVLVYCDVPEFLPQHTRVFCDERKRAVLVMKENNTDGK